MRMVVSLASAFLAAAWLAGSAAADETLAQAAEKEKARRAGQQAGKVRTYGDDDLKKMSKGPSEPQSATPTAGAQAAPAPSDSAGESTSVLAQRISEKQAEIAKLKADIEGLELKIKQLRAGFDLGGINSVNRQRDRNNEITQALHDIEEKQQALKLAESALEDLEEAARQAGVVPGEPPPAAGGEGPEGPTPPPSGPAD